MAVNSLPSDLWYEKRTVRYAVSIAIGFATLVVAAGPALADESTDNAGPMNVSSTENENSAGGINDSVFIAVEEGLVSSGADFTATSSPGTVSVPVYAIPVGETSPITGADNATVWVPTPSGATSVDLAWSAGTDSPENYPTVASSAGASLSVTQDADGSRGITAVAVIPKFTGITDAFFLQSVSTGGFGNYAFHVFDADTGAWIDPGRTGVQKSIVTVDGTSMLQMVDPLVLPESALGRNIRVGFVSYYYQSAWNATPAPIPLRYAGLSAAILMRLSQAAPSTQVLAALQQFAVPAGTQVEECGALAPDNVDVPALRQMRDEGWSISYAQWPSEGQGGWVCSRQPLLTPLGWIVQ